MSKLEMFAEARANFMRDGDALRAQFFYFSPANVLPKLALDKLDIQPYRDGWVILSPDGKARVLPTGSKSDYYQRLVNAAEDFPGVLLVPEPYAKPMAGAYRVTPQQKEFILPTDVVRTHEAPRLDRLRKYIRAAGRRSRVTAFVPDDADAFLALNQLWYRQAAPTKFRTYDKVAIDWLIENFSQCLALSPDLTMLGVWDADSERLLSLNIGSALTAQMWTAYTERYDRDAPFRQSNTLGFSALAAMFDQPHENDGTADSKPIREIKERYQGTLLSAYQVEGRK